MFPIQQQADLQAFLGELGATPSEATELLAYSQNPFDASTLKEAGPFPLSDQPSVAAWTEYAEQGQIHGVYPVLRERLVQLRFPVRQGISQTANYAAATRRGVAADTIPEAVGLDLERPDQLELDIHQTVAGKIPIVTSGHRPDFVTLIQALAHRNEPTKIPDSMGAALVKGFNNWDRIRSHKDRWQAENPGLDSESDWQAEFRRMIPRKELYQDVFIVLSRGEYSGVAAEELGLTADQWRQMSYVVRREHETVHYLTLRLCGSTRNHAYDELLADYAGICAATGSYRVDWFLRFMGLDTLPDFRSGGRLENYLGNPPLSPGAFRILQVIVQKAAENLKKRDRQYAKGGVPQTTKVLLSLLRMGLLELARIG